MLLNASPINATVINGSVGDYQILIGSLVSSATADYIPVALIKPFSSSIDITALASCYPSVRWVLAANVSVTATDSSVLYKTSVLDGVGGSVVTTVYGSLNKTDILNSAIDVVATCSTPILSRYTWFESDVTTTASTIADILKVVNMDSGVICSVVVPNTNVDLHKNLFVSNLVSAIISNSHLKHLYTQSGLDLEMVVGNITISDIKIDYIITG